MRADLWNALLDAEMNLAYWDALARRTIGRDRVVKVLLAIFTSGTAASLILTFGDLRMWRITSAATAIVSITLTVGGLVP